MFALPRVACGRPVAGRSLVLAVLLILLSAPSAFAVEDLGSVRFPTSGSGEAQVHFLRGVAALHSFWYPEAREEFRRARELEPGFAMAAWGEAMTHNHPVWDQVELAEGRDALERLAPTAEARASEAPTERERAYLEAVEILFFGQGGKVDRDLAYEQAMERLAARWPDDVEAAVFHALAVEGVVYGGVAPERRLPLLMEAAAGLEELFDHHPRHPGILHYLIHAYDDPTHAPLGLRAARTYAEVAPAAPHALHMPSHIFVQRGLWDRAEDSNMDAWQASVDWVAERGLPATRKDFHSLSWLLYARLQQGRWEAARQTLELAREHAGAGARVDRYRAGMEARYAIERAAAESASPVPGELLGPDPDHPGVWLAVAVAAHGAGDDGRAREAAERLGAIAAEEGEGPVAVMAREAEGLAELAAGRTREGLEALARAAAVEERLDPPSGPPDTVKPAHELYGEMLLVHDRPEQAARQLEISLRRTPRRALSLLGAARAAAALGRSEDTRRHYREYLEVRRDADAMVAGIEEARRHLDAGDGTD